MVEDPRRPPWDAALQHPEGVVGGRRRSLADRLDAWVADARLDDAAAARTRERWLHQAAEEERSLAGVLLDLAEHGADITATTTGGRQHHGTVEALGADFVVLRLATGTEALLAIRSVAAIRTAPGMPATLGDRVSRTELRLADVLGELAGTRERAVVVAQGAEGVRGELRSVGHDVLVVRSDGVPPATVYLPLAAIDEVVLA